jgi:predicted nucleic-acid-binding protein
LRLKEQRSIPDTNAILRYLLADIPELHEKSSAFFEEVRTGRRRALILESVLAECVYVLMKYYNVPRRETAERLSGLMLYKGIINEDRDELIAALEMFAGKNLDIVDCILCIKAGSYRMGLFSFDTALKNCAS